MMLKIATCGVGPEKFFGYLSVGSLLNLSLQATSEINFWHGRRPMKLRLLKTYMGKAVYVNVDNIVYVEVIAGFHPTAANPHGERIARVHFDGGRCLDLGASPEKIIAHFETGEW